MQKKRIPSRARMRPFFCPRIVSTRPRIETRTSSCSTPGSSTSTRIVLPSSSTSRLGSQELAEPAERLCVSTKTWNSRFSSLWSRESSTSGP